jgi:hypothetical protein
MAASASQCPFCKSPVGGRPRELPEESLDREVQLDISVTDACLAVLAVLALVGCGVLLWLGRASEPGSRLGILLSLAGLAFGAILVTGLALGAWGRREATRQAGRAAVRETVTGLSTAAFRTAIGCGLLALVGFAALVFLSAVCKVSIH